MALEPAQITTSPQIIVTIGNHLILLVFLPLGDGHLPGTCREMEYPAGTLLDNDRCLIPETTLTLATHRAYLPLGDGNPADDSF